MCRRDKENCHECRYCCTLSVCTKKKGYSTYKHSNATLEGVRAKGAKKGAPTVVMGYSTDARMYKSYDFRCLKPKAGVPIEKWPHYEMEGFRAAKSQKELDAVEEIPFDKYFFNFEDPKVFKSMTDGSKNALSLWKKSYGFDWADFTQGEGAVVKLRKIYKHCLQAEYGDFAKKCKKEGGLFKCCSYS